MVPRRHVADLLSNWEAELAAKGGFVSHDAARAFLTEFGGLAWPLRDVGEHLMRYAFNLVPTTAVFEDDRFADAAAMVGESVYPVGEVISGRYFLAVAESGSFWIVMDDVESYGPDPWAVFDRLLLVR